MYRTALTDNSLLMEAYNAGNIEDVAEDLLRYHSLVRDSQVEHCGNFYREREIHVSHEKGVTIWYTAMKNGRVIEVYYEENN